MNWYDYSWSLEALKQAAPDWEDRLRTKRFSRGRHNDARFVRWPLDDVAFTALAGNRAMEELLVRHHERIPFVFSGHTHRERENTFHGTRGYNIGGDYHYKRLLLLDWPARTVVAHQFGDPNAVATA